MHSNELAAYQYIAYTMTAVYISCETRDSPELSVSRPLKFPNSSRIKVAQHVCLVCFSHVRLHQVSAMGMYFSSIAFAHGLVAPFILFLAHRLLFEKQTS